MAFTRCEYALRRATASVFYVIAPACGTWLVHAKHLFVAATASYCRRSDEISWSIIRRVSRRARAERFGSGSPSQRCASVRVSLASCRSRSASRALHSAALTRRPVSTYRWVRCRGVLGNSMRGEIRPAAKISKPPLRLSRGVGVDHPAGGLNTPPAGAARACAGAESGRPARDCAVPFV